MKTLNLSYVLFLSFHQFASSKKFVRENFLWGTATAAYQIEGATSEDGRQPSIWDIFSVIPGKIHNSDNGSIADDSYHKVITDIQLLKNMGLNAYRFSISWSRIVPTGQGAINQAGIDHYQFVIDQLIAAGIEPLVTLYHWDLPQGLEDKYDGLLSPQLETDFVHFADVCFSSFGDRVKKWITLNEPWTVALQGYVTGNFAPGRCSDRKKCIAGDSEVEGYIAAHNMLNAHAAVVELYRSKYQSIQHGIIGITLNHDFGAPLRSDNSDDIAAAHRRNEFSMAWFADPIHFGRYPQSMIDLVGDRMPTFNEAQRQRLIQSFDFIGLNHYSTRYFTDINDVNISEYMSIKCGLNTSNSNTTNTTTSLGGWFADQLTAEYKYDTQCNLIGPQADSVWLNTVPWGFYNTIMFLHDRYSVAADDVISINDNDNRVSSSDAYNKTGPLIYITESGCDVPGESEMTIAEAVQDSFRVNYLSQYLEQMDRAIADGANIVGYFAWSLLDNFEWADGYSKRFGLHYVDYTSPNRTRYPKNSAYWYANYTAENANKYMGRIVGTENDDVVTDDDKESPSTPTTRTDVDTDCSEWKSCLWNAIINVFETNTMSFLFDL